LEAKDQSLLASRWGLKFQFFHAVASARKKRNIIAHLNDLDSSATTYDHISVVFPPNISAISIQVEILMLVPLLIMWTLRSMKKTIIFLYLLSAKMGFAKLSSKCIMTSDSHNPTFYKHFIGFNWG